MAERKRKKQQWSLGEQVEVPDADDMDDETFLRHLDKRHSHEVKTEKALHMFPHIQAAWVGPYRAYHDLQHRTHPEENYDHVHVWDDDDDD